MDLPYEKGSFTQRNVYGADGERISTELSYADGIRRGGQGENIASDIAANDIEKVWYRTSHLDSTLFAVDAGGDVVFHAIYDPWGNPVTDTGTDLNFSGLDNRNNYTGYTWDETLELYFAQARFYDPAARKFTQEDTVKDGVNWYPYVANTPTNAVDPTGTETLALVWGSTTWPLIAVDGPLPIGDLIYVVGYGVCVVADAVILYNTSRAWDTPQNKEVAKNITATIVKNSTATKETTDAKQVPGKGDATKGENII